MQKKGSLTLIVGREPIIQRVQRERGKKRTKEMDVWVRQLVTLQGITKTEFPEEKKREYLPNQEYQFLIGNQATQSKVCRIRSTNGNTNNGCV